jgi:hypothetical protein
MPAEALVRDGFNRSPTFNEQVNGIVVEQALYKNALWTQQGKLDPTTRDALGRVARNPSGYGFVSAIVNLNNFALKYDEWAAAPDSKKQAIEGYISDVWLLLTNIDEPPAPPPP